MKRNLLVLCIAATFAGQLSAAELKRVENPIQGQYIVVFKDGVQSEEGKRRGPPQQVVDTVVDIAARHDLPVDRIYEHALQGFVTRASESQIRRLLNDDRIAFVEEDGMSYPSVTQFNATWGLDRVDQRNLPLNGTYVYDSGASNVRAYVIDTGILTGHNDLAGRVLPGRTFISDGRGTSDCNGHGTHVAGTIAGTTWGIAKQARVVPVRVFGCTGGASNSTIAAAIDWVKANHVKPAVVNMSLGGSANSTVDTATNNLINAGVLAVVAAGNGNANACNFSPARVGNALTIGATASNDARSVWSSTQASNFGSCLDLFAPGTSITSAWWTSASATNTISGTSMASPHAAGTAALHLELNPTATPSAVASAIINNATTGKVTNPGTGSPNRLLYTRFVAAPPPPPPPSLAVNLTCTFTGLIGSGPLYDCQAFASGGAQPYTFQWSSGSVWQEPSQAFVEADCGFGQSSSDVIVWVNDSVGGFASDHETLSCNPTYF